MNGTPCTPSSRGVVPKRTARIVDDSYENLFNDDLSFHGSRGHSQHAVIHNPVLPKIDHHQVTASTTKRTSEGAISPPTSPTSPLAVPKLNEATIQQQQQQQQSTSPKSISPRSPRSRRSYSVPVAPSASLKANAAAPQPFVARKEPMAAVAPTVFSRPTAVAGGGTAAADGDDDDEGAFDYG